MTSDFSVLDGGDVPTCTKIDNIQWTYNNGQFLAGSAYMYNYVHRSADGANLRQTEMRIGRVISTNFSTTQSKNSLQHPQISSTNQPAK